MDDSVELIDFLSGVATSRDNDGVSTRGGGSFESKLVLADEVLK